MADAAALPEGARRLDSQLFQLHLLSQALCSIHQTKLLRRYSIATQTLAPMKRRKRSAPWASRSPRRLRPDR